MPPDRKLSLQDKFKSILGSGPEVQLPILAPVSTPSPQPSPQPSVPAPTLQTPEVGDVAPSIRLDLTKDQLSTEDAGAKLSAQEQTGLKAKILELTGLNVQAPEEPAPILDPERVKFEEVGQKPREAWLNDALSRAKGQAFLKASQPDRSWDDLDPAEKETALRMYEGRQIYSSPMSDSEVDYNENVKLGQSNWLRDAARIFTAPKNIIPAVIRGAAGAAKGATIGVVDVTKPVQDLTENLGENWLKESQIPEIAGEVYGAVALTGPVVRGLGAVLNMAAKPLIRFGTYLFGAEKVNQAIGAAQAVESAANATSVGRVSLATVKGAASEGSLGFAAGLARDPKEGENRFDNAVDSALTFAGLSALIRGGLEWKAVRNDARIGTAIDRLASDLKVSKVEAEQILFQRNPSARKTSDLVPELIDAVPREGIQKLPETNEAILKYADRKRIPIEQASKEVRMKYPGLPVDTKLYEKIGDTELATDTYRSWFENNVIGKNETGQLTIQPFRKGLEAAGKWLYDNEGLTVLPGVKLQTVGGKDVRKIRNFLVGERSAEADAVMTEKLKLLAAKRRVTMDALDFTNELEKGVTSFAEKAGVSEGSASKRIAQILQGGVTENQALRYLGDEYLRIHKPLERELQELKILGDTRFIQKSRAEINQLFQSKEASIQKITAAVPTSTGRSELQKLLREQEFKSVDEMTEVLTKNYGLNVKPSQVQQLFDDSRFIRSSYRNAGVVHMKRFYEVHEQGRKTALGFFLKREASGPINRANFKERLDLSKEVRDSLGQIEDVTYQAGKSIYEQIEGVMRGQFAKTISKNPVLSMPAESKFARGIFHMNPEAKRLVDEEGWVHLPNDTRWGELKDHVIAPQIHQELKAFGALPGQTDGVTQEMAGIYKSLIKAWKYGKVVLNPGTWMRNAGSNTMLMEASGVSYFEQLPLAKKAVQELIAKGDIYREASEAGLFQGGFFTDDLLQHLQEKLQKGKHIQEGLANFFGLTASKEFVKKAGLKVGEAYQANDDLFKMMKYLHMRGEGYRSEVAVKEAQKWLFNYSDVPRSVQVAKDYFSPFITFSAKVAPRFFETLIERPWKMWKYAQYFNALGNVSAALPDAEDSKYGLINTLANFLPDDLKRETYVMSQWRDETVLPDYAKTTLKLPEWPAGMISEDAQKAMEKFTNQYGLRIPRMIRMPFKDEFGRDMWFDLAGYVPFGQLFDSATLGAYNIPRILLPQHPLFDMGVIGLFNIDPFTGKKIADKDDPLKSQKYISLIGRTIMPNLFPGGYSYQKLDAAWHGEMDSKQRVRSLPIAAMDVLLGLKLRPFDLDDELRFRKQEAESRIEELHLNIKQLKRDYEKGVIRDEGYLDEKVQEYKDVIDRIREKKGALSDFGGD